MLFVTVSRMCVPRYRLNFYVIVMPRRVFLAKSLSVFHPVLSVPVFFKVLLIFTVFST